MAALEGQRLVAELLPDYVSKGFEVSMLMSRQEISIAETTVNRKRQSSQMMMKA